METHNRYHIDVFVVFLFHDASSVMHFKCPLILGLFIILPCHLLLTSYVASMLNSFHWKSWQIKIVFTLYAIYPWKNFLYFVHYLLHFCLYSYFLTVCNFSSNQTSVLLVSNKILLSRGTSLYTQDAYIR